jgi:5-methylcytosine-specific restriction endonuclease McrA
MGRLNPDTGLYRCRGFGDQGEHWCPAAEMVKHAGKAHGLATICKACKRAYSAKHHDKAARQSDKAARSAKPEVKAAKAAHDAKPEVREAYNARMRKGGDGYEKKLARNAKRRARKRGAFVLAESRPATLAKCPVCFYCGCVLTLDTMEQEHRIPLPPLPGSDRWPRFAGQTEPGNLVSSCGPCNWSKRDREVFSGHGEPSQLGLPWLMQRFDERVKRGD